MKIEINPKTQTNILGEFLRDLFFKNTFDLKDGLEKSEEPVPEWDVDQDPPKLTYKDTEYKFTCAELNGVKCKFYFDGDMFLSFELPTGEYLVNNDAKKDYNWRYYISFKSYWKSF